MRQGILGLTALIFVLAAAPAAQAANAEVRIAPAGPERVIYLGSLEVDDVSLSTDSTPNWIFQRGALPGAVHMTAGEGCDDVLEDGTRVSCPIDDTALPPIIGLNSGDDRLTTSALSRAILVNGGFGADILSVSSSAPNSIGGDFGEDEIVLATATKADFVSGGPDDDTFIQPTGKDDVFGEEGVDTVVLSGATGTQLTVTLDGVADDGVAGQSANIHREVENVTGGSENDTFVGSSSANALTGAGGGDSLDGQGGTDTLNAGDGNDTVQAQDGGPDTVDCGPGTDTASVDLADVTTGCETIQLPDADKDGVPAGADCADDDPSIHPGAVDTAGDGVDQDCSGADTSLPPPAAAGIPPEFRLSTKALTVSKKGIAFASFVCRAPVGDLCIARGTVRANTGKRALRRRRAGASKLSSIGRISGRVHGRESGKLKIRLTSRGLRLLKARRALRVTISGRVTNRAGQSKALRSRIKLKAPRRRRR